AMGSFVHAPTIAQLLEGNSPDIAKKAREVLQACEAVLESPVFNTRFEAFVHLTCQQCGSAIRVRKQLLDRERTVTCPKHECGTVYDIVETGENGDYQFKPQHLEFKCANCQQLVVFPGAMRVEGRTVKCDNCIAEYAFVNVLQLV